MGEMSMPAVLVQAIAEVDAAHRAYLDAQGPFDRARDAYFAANDASAGSKLVSLPADDVKRLMLARYRTWSEYEAVMGPYDRAKSALATAIGRAHDAFGETCLPVLPTWP